MSPKNNLPVVAGHREPVHFFTLQAKREKESDELRRSGDKFIEFLDRADRWLSQNTKKIVELFRRFDQSGEGVVTHDEFKAGEHKFHDVLPSGHLIVNIDFSAFTGLEKYSRQALYVNYF